MTKYTHTEAIEWRIIGEEERGLIVFSRFIMEKYTKKFVQDTNRVFWIHNGSEVGGEKGGQKLGKLLFGEGEEFFPKHIPKHTCLLLVLRAVFR
jgi:hypothetical protein